MLKVLVVGLAVAAVVWAASAAMAGPSVEDMAASIAASHNMPAAHGPLMFRLFDKALARLTTKRLVDTGAAPPAWDSTSPMYLPEAGMKGPIPLGLTRVTLWRGHF